MSTSRSSLLLIAAVASLTPMHLLCQEAWFGLASASGSEPAFSSVVAVTEPDLLQAGGLLVVRSTPTSW